MFIKRDEKQIENYGELSLQDVFEVVSNDISLNNPHIVEECYEHLTDEEMMTMRFEQDKEAKVLIDNNEMDSLLEELDATSETFHWIFDEAASPLEFQFCGDKIILGRIGNIPIEHVFNLAQKFDASLYNEFNRKVEPKKQPKKKSFFDLFFK